MNVEDAGLIKLDHIVLHVCVLCALVGPGLTVHPDALRFSDLVVCCL